MLEYDARPIPETTSDLGPGYQTVVQTIEAGIKKSQANGYGVEKVSFNGSEIPLPEYLATELFRIYSRKEITKAGLEKILETYNNRDARRSMGATSVSATNRYQSGSHTYRDFKSAAASDYDER